MSAAERTLRVGARGSDLSLAQTRWVIDRLERAHPGLHCRLLIIETHGDRHAGAMEGLPVGSFVSDIERALLDGRLDVAVHSLKDLPVDDRPGLTVAAVPERELPHDLLLTRTPVDLFALPEDLVIGTSSPRRAAQLRTFAPQAIPRAIRGNVPTRIAKLAESEYGGIILAAAGLTRLGIAHRYEYPLPLPHFLPAPGQGALAVQTRSEDDGQALARAIEHAPTRAAVTAERAFLRASGGGCHAALGAWAVAEAYGQSLRLHGQVFIDGHPRADDVLGPITDPASIGEALAERLLTGTP